MVTGLLLARTFLVCRPSVGMFAGCMSDVVFQSLPANLTSGQSNGHVDTSGCPAVVREMYASLRGWPLMLFCVSGWAWGALHGNRSSFIFYQWQPVSDRGVTVFSYEPACSRVSPHSLSLWWGTTLTGNKGQNWAMLQVKCDYGLCAPDILCRWTSWLSVSTILTFEWTLPIFLLTCH